MNLAADKPCYYSRCWAYALSGHYRNPDQDVAIATLDKVAIIPVNDLSMQSTALIQIVDKDD